MNNLNQEIIKHWKQLRKMSYDLLEIVPQEKIGESLPFKSSQTFGYQYMCMLGTQETYVDYLVTGNWTRWSCSMENFDDPKKEGLLERLKLADERFEKVLQNVDLLKAEGDGTPLSRYLLLVEHESHHQGQMINFIYALGLDIPDSWKEKWELKK